MQHNNEARRRTDRNEVDARITELENKIAQLQRSPVFGCYSRAGIEDVLAGADLSDRAVVYFDIDNMKQANEQHGKTGVNLKIRAALGGVRETDIVIGQWFSGDEFIALVTLADAFGFVTHLRAAFIREGLGATFAVLSIADGIEAATERADQLITASKVAGRKGGILWDL
jgi:GGDEF domain-containing protein